MQLEMHNKIILDWSSLTHTDEELINSIYQKDGKDRLSLQLKMELLQWPTKRINIIWDNINDLDN